MIPAQLSILSADVFHNDHQSVLLEISNQEKEIKAHLNVENKNTIGDNCLTCEKKTFCYMYTYVSLVFLINLIQSQITFQMIVCKDRKSKTCILYINFMYM